MRVSDDHTASSQFPPTISPDPASGDIAVAWYDSRSDLGTGGPGDTDGLPNNADRADRFLTIDRWRTERDWRSFLDAFGPAYESLDAQLEGLPAAERSLFKGSS